MDKEIKKSTNIIKISGILVENNLKARSYVKDGQTIEYIAGDLTIRVDQPIGGIQETSDIPVQFWVSKLKKDGDINPAYESVEKAMNTYISLVAAENESLATKVLINSAQIVENIFWKGGKCYCSPKISATFISTATPTAYTPEATFLTDIVVGNITDETDKEGIATGRLKVKGLVGQFSGTMDQIDYVVEKQDAIDYIRSYWNVGDTVQIGGKIRYSSKTDKVEVPTRFGDPVIKTVTRNIKDFIIMSDSTDALTENMKFTKAEVEEGMKKRAVAVEKAKERSLTENSKNSSSEKTASQAANPYGF